ncbi:unnamed protein product, partial [Heligmosomoides polygyrus]|uniref:Protein kinase domain-containing protein n=1 Tax=Heligmosomoides polygyrus TaxID=6339 RepID=A0A183G0G8_HELPZ
WSASPTNFAKGQIISKRWKVKQKLGEGGFGAVYKVLDLETKNNILRTLGDIPYFPHLLDSGKKSTYSYIVITLLGPSLNKILKFFGRVCSISTQVRIGINTLYALKQLHDIGFLHRDLKPGNVAVGPVGTPEFRFIHIFDFGLARRFIITQSGQKPPKMRRPRPRVHFRGTLRYCSINCHEKGEQGRDDDLWCFFYMLVELRGRLPWSNVREGLGILEMKRTVDVEELLKDCPVEFISIEQHLKSLNYYLRPDYALIYRLLMQVMNAGNFKYVLSFNSLNGISSCVYMYIYFFVSGCEIQ